MHNRQCQHVPDLPASAHKMQRGTATRLVWLAEWGTALPGPELAPSGRFWGLLLLSVLLPHWGLCFPDLSRFPSFLGGGREEAGASPVCSQTEVRLRLPAQSCQPSEMTRDSLTHTQPAPGRAWHSGLHPPPSQLLPQAAAAASGELATEGTESQCLLPQSPLSLSPPGFIEAAHSRHAAGGATE